VETYNSTMIVTRSRTAIKADSGDICLVPFWAEIEDVMLHLLGCDIAIVLRKCEDGSYKFIGECYIRQVKFQDDKVIGRTEN
jgi:hypothetical protein